MASIGKFLIEQKTVVLFIYMITLIGYSQQKNTYDLYISGTENIKEFRIPSMITTNAGTVLAVCDARVNRNGDVPNNVDQVLKRSTDNGKNWSNLLRVVDFPNMEGAADPSLLQDDETSRIFLFYGYSPGRNNVEKGANRDRRYLSLHYVFSDDDGISWSMPLVVEHGLKKEGWHSLWPGPGRGLQLKNKRLIMPVSVYDHTSIDSYYLYSDDHGKSWEISNLVGFGINEPTIVELENGDLLMNCRTRVNNRAIVTSEDGGETWGKPIYHKNLIEPGCQGSFISTVYKGKNLLIFSNPSSLEGRKNMTIKVSMDNGKSWPIVKTIYEGPSAYSCLTVLENGQIGLLYENGEKSPYEKISFTSLKIKEILKSNE
jgi:sialidase-1